MTKDTIAKCRQASIFIETIEIYELNVKRLEHALSDSFVKRETTLNILGTSQEEGYVFIPKGAMKTVMYVSLNECKRLVEDYKKQLEEL